MASITTQPYLPQALRQPTLAQVALETALVGGASAITAGIFTTISLLGGAIFGASFALSNRLIYWISEKINCCPSGTLFEVARFALSMISSISAAALITTIAGFPLTLTTGILLVGVPVGAVIATVTVGYFLVLGYELARARGVGSS
jgi:hypothetical protein